MRGERLYRVLLRLYPRAFRDAYEAALLEAFRNERAETGEGAWLECRFWGRIVADTVASAIRLRIAALCAADPASILGDVRQGARRLRRRPAFALTAVLTLGLGIGATTAVYSIVDGILLRPLPWHEPHRVVTLWQVRPEWAADPVLSAFAEAGTFSWSAVRDFQSDATALSEVAAWTAPQVVLQGELNEVVSAMQVSAGFLPMLGVEPALGRAFTAEEDDLDTGAALVSHETWQRRFGGRADVLGSTVRLDGERARIVGVLPPGFRFQGPAPEFVLPMGRLSAAVREDGGNLFYVVGRLQGGATIADAEVVAQRIVRAGSEASRGARVTPLADEQLGGVQRPLWFVLGAAGALLLIALANVAGLSVADAHGRRGELAVRAALGAGRMRLIGQLLAESFWLGALGGALGILLALWLTPLLLALSPEPLPRAEGVRFDVRVLAFALVATLTTILLFGGGAAAALTRKAGPHPAALTGGVRHSDGQHARLTQGVVVCQLALAFALVVGASLLGETLLRLSRQPLGFDPSALTLIEVRPPSEGPSSAEARKERTRQIVGALEAAAGVSAAAATGAAPFGGGFATTRVAAAEGEARTLSTQQVVVTPEYFDVLRVPAVSGRLLRAADADGPPVAVVSRSFESRYLNGDGVGRRFVASVPFEVVGVVDDMKHRGMDDDSPVAFYALERHLPNLGATQFVTRGSRAATAGGGLTTAEVGRIVQQAVPGATVTSVDSFNRLIARATAAERFRAVLASAFSVLAIIIAATGLYGAVARSVAARRREIGVRQALGAGRRQVIRMILEQVGGTVALGLLVGLPLAWLAARFVASLLFGVAPGAVHIFAFAVGVLAASAALATAIPLRTATRISPSDALREG